MVMDSVNVKQTMQARGVISAVSGIMVFRIANVSCFSYI